MELTPENFDTTALLRAVDAVDVLRGELNDSTDGAWVNTSNGKEKHDGQDQNSNAG
ncbi:TPA: hypothetical protein ACWMEO_005643 [Pseudomonas aeruginosa]